VPTAPASAAKPPTPVTASPSAPGSGGNSGDEDLGWIWPASGSLIAGFDDAKNKGYDISGKAGDPVLAAADGRVVYAGAGLRGYGNLIILKHNNTYLTAYAHNQTLLVKEDQSVQKGQKIAEMGNSDADRVKLHFEIRRQGKPVDPRYLPIGDAMAASRPRRTMPVRGSAGERPGGHSRQNVPRLRMSRSRHPEPTVPRLAAR
jgi:lipoprotein NlpD